MCGIVGYIGENQAVPVLLNGLSKLEYRGYDSAGISVYHDGIHTIKVKGKLAGLREKVETISPSYKSSKSCATTSVSVSDLKV